MIPKSYSRPPAGSEISPHRFSPRVDIPLWTETENQVLKKDIQIEALAPPNPSKMNNQLQNNNDHIIKVPEAMQAANGQLNQDVEYTQALYQFEDITTHFLHSHLPTPPPAATNPDYIPDEFECSMTLEIMKDPVIAADGHSYERKSIEAWLDQNNTSPKTNQGLSHKMLTPNHALRSMIKDYEQKKNP
eukprot:3658607-Ditylum_brightwellii.AAC.1